MINSANPTNPVKTSGRRQTGMKGLSFPEGRMATVRGRMSFPTFSTICSVARTARNAAQVPVLVFTLAGRTIMPA
jgi:hypothetical protein